MSNQVIDTLLLGRPGVAASHLIVENGHGAFVDTGTGWAVPLLLAALKQASIPVENVDYVMVTHVHLDHAGGAGGLMRELPNARLVVHPRGARHMIDPGKLIAGATAVYGEGRMHDNFGPILPVPAERVIEAADGYAVDLAGRILLCLDTPGHARHHYCVVDEADRTIYTGDTFGLSYRPFDTANGPFVLPTTTPVQFDPEAMHGSIDRLMATGPRQVCLTHFGCIPASARLAADLHRRIDGFVALARQCADAGEERHQCIERAMGEYLVAEARAHGCTMPPERILGLLEIDLELNTQGLGVWLDKIG